MTSDSKEKKQKSVPAQKRGLDTYTKTTLIEGEKIVYSARLHKFSRYWGAVLAIIGALMFSPELIGPLWEKSGISQSNNASELTKSISTLSEKKIKNTKDTASLYIKKAQYHWNNFLAKLSPKMRSMLLKAMDTRRRLVASVLFAFGVYTLIISILRKHTMEHTITTYKVLKKKGLISVQASEVPLKQIEGARVKQSILDRFIHRGTVLVTGVGMERIEAKHIADPEIFRKKINEAVHRYS